jgi:hypothetical protein
MKLINEGVPYGVDVLLEGVIQTDIFDDILLGRLFQLAGIADGRMIIDAKGNMYFRVHRHSPCGHWNEFLAR